MSRIDLPISDYVGDQTSVLDQGIRIIQASIDVLAELGYMPACLMMMTLLQSIKSARWPEDHPLSILPGVATDTKTNNTNIPTSLKAVTASAISSLPKKLHLPSATTAQFTKAASSLPQLSLAVSDISTTGLTVTLTRQNSPTNAAHRVYAPRFPKPQTEGFFLLVSSGSTENAPILALKRVSWQPVTGGGRKRPDALVTTRSVVKFPATIADVIAGGKGVDVRVVSDAYPGMEWSAGPLNIPDTENVNDDAAQKASSMNE
jgi:antiviral helicase SLH1